MKKQQLNVVGHRGAAGLAEENTMGGFRAALRYGVDAVEVDIRQTKDGMLVLHHDPVLLTPGGHRLVITQTLYKDLLAAHPTVTTLEQALRYLDKRAKVMIDLKDPGALIPTTALVKTYLKRGWKPSDFMFASGKLPDLQGFHAILPTIPLIVIERWLVARAIRRANVLGTPYISMNQVSLWWGIVRLLAPRFKLYSYSYEFPWLGRQQRPKRWAKHGLYGVITDRPDFFHGPK